MMHSGIWMVPATSKSKGWKHLMLLIMRGRGDVLY